MGRFAWIVVIIVLAMAFYHHFYSDSLEDADDRDAPRRSEARAPDRKEMTPTIDSPPIPEECQSDASTAENAMYGAQNHQVSFAQRNRAVRKFQSCLREQGLSDAEIEAALEAKKEKVRRYLKMDAGG